MIECGVVLVGYAVNSKSGGGIVGNVKYLDTVGIKYLYSHFYETYCAEPLAFLQLAAQLESRGIKTEILDGLIQGQGVEEILDCLEDYKTDIYVFSFYESSENDVYEMITTLKKRSSNATVIIGGPHPTIDYRRIMSQFKQIDYLILGDADIALPNLVESILSGRKINIDNVISRSSDGGVLYPRAVSSIDINLIEKPKRFYSKLIEEKGFSFSMATSRGCAHAKCSFCYLARYQHFGRQPKHRLRSPEIIIEEMKDLINIYGITKLTFVDEDFFGSSQEGIQRALRIFRLMIEERIYLRLYVNARAKSILKLIELDCLDILEQAGVSYFFIGFESYNDSILKKYNKGLTTSDIDKVCNELDKRSIKVNPGLITFEPEITLEEVKRNIELYRKIDYYDLFMFTRQLMILPGNSKHKVAENYFFNSDVKNLYDGLVAYRDKVYKIYSELTKEKVTETLRNSLIRLHFSFFDQLVSVIEDKEILNNEMLVEQWSNKVMKTIDLNDTMSTIY